MIDRVWSPTVQISPSQAGYLARSRNQLKIRFWWKCLSWGASRLVDKYAALVGYKVQLCDKLVLLHQRHQKAKECVHYTLGIAQ